jgi:hypothetical protein
VTQGATASILGAILLQVFVIGAARAQTPEASLGPLANPGEVTEVTRSALDAALPGRAKCRELVDLVNDQGLRWGRIRRDTLDADSFKRQVTSADYDWGEVSNQCGRAWYGLDEGLPRQVLEHDASLLKDLHEAMGGVETLWLADEPVEEVNRAMAKYRAAAQGYAHWAAAASDFWLGAWLGSDHKRSCVDDIGELVQDAAAALRMQLVLVPDERDSDVLLKLSDLLDSIETQRAGCAPPDAARRMELELLGRMLGIYNEALSGLLAGDDAKVSQAMAAEQATTERRARCRAEHDSAAVSTLCRPRDPRTGPE